MTITLQEIPYPADEVDDGLEYFFSTILPLITMLTISFVIFMSVQLNMRRDQNSGMNDLLVANGVKMWIILLGWFIYHTFILVLTLIPVVLILTITNWGSSHTPIQYCSVFVLYVFLLLYSLANVSFFLFWACVARSSTITYMVAVIISLVTCFISLTTISESETSFSIATQMIMSIFFMNASLRSGFKAICVQDQTIRSKGKVGLHGIGYFPENNQMRYWINGLDLLILAGLTRGFSYAKSTEAANLLIDIFDLRQLANVKCANYSGGNKKRLQICIAFMGFLNFVKIHNASWLQGIYTQNCHSGNNKYEPIHSGMR